MNNKHLNQQFAEYAQEGLNVSTHYAAIDLGSNSFHMAIAQYDGQAFQIIGKIKEKVQLASGLDKHNMLSEEAMQIGLNCLKLFSERLNKIPKSQIKIVATYTLRKAKNAHVFIQKAEKILSAPIEILPGTEEARLIYNGVSHDHPDINRALVIDIGGGSTEVILGKKFEHQQLDSLSLGCVTFKRYFKNGLINEANFQKAILNAALIISPVESRYTSELWQHCLGSSGSIEAIYNVIQAFGFRDTSLTLEHLYFLKEKLIEIGSIDKIKLEGLTASRVNTFATGLAILIALFEGFKIPKMYISSASLREGILLELAEELKGNDNRNQTVASLVQRFNIDQSHGEQVKKTAQYIFDGVSDLWGIYDPHSKNLLDWASTLHEIGLSISYNKMRYHSSHIIQYADMPGFSLQTQESLAVIILSQNKKLLADRFQDKYEPASNLLAVTQILRLSLLFNIKRDGTDITALTFEAKPGNELLIKIPSDWYLAHQLIIFELEKEQKYWAYHQLEISWQII